MKNMHVAVCVTGGIAAYKAVIFIRKLIKANAEVKVIMTEEAATFVTPLTFKTISRNQVYYENSQQQGIVEHVELAKWTDIAVIIPATANTIGKLANGIADNFATTCLIAMNCPKFIVPAMNDKMYDNQAVQRNLKQLIEDGYHMLEPDTGFLAEGYDGKGRMPEPDTIFKWVSDIIANKQDLKGKRVVVTAGHTIEAIDPVRYITNHSSGKMGFAVARNAVQRGADVTLISGPSHLINDTGARLIAIRTTAQMYEAVKERYSDADIVIMSAAVADYHVIQPAKQKIKKTGKRLTLELEKNIDILKKLGQEKKAQKLVGFAAETQNLLENGQQKLINKNLDLLVANDVSRSDIGFGSDENEVIFMRPSKENINSPKTNKDDIAKMIFDLITED
ncbi:MAG: bifunctional phosphopantothenoylcysteine decarboxylase/phosphopantothenate--cysteine ligase CoaBC [Liquorilactobacillus sp.]|uniref:bifunctional phosphopantothenoylcysteine decarboxylase/phosphopantothenate--cysteine ligase CoaBC n=1 Tax=Liquorilactobacillus sp. TaxID=2767923 RepID=UPI0039EB1609